MKRITQKIKTTVANIKLRFNIWNQQRKINSVLKKHKKMLNNKDN